MLDISREPARGRISVYHKAQNFIGPRNLGNFGVNSFYLVAVVLRILFNLDNSERKFAYKNDAVRAIHYRHIIRATDSGVTIHTQRYK